MGVGVAKALGASPVMLVGTERDRRRLEIGRKLGADEVVDVSREDAVAAVMRITRGKGAHYVIECSGAPNAVNEAARMVSRGGRICLAAFAQDPVLVDVAHLVSNNIYLFGIRGEGRSATRRAAALMAQKRFPAQLLHTHTLSARGGADGDPLRSRAHRGRDQGRGENALGAEASWRKRKRNTGSSSYSRSSCPAAAGSRTRTIPTRCRRTSA